jgi:hypothetical protein
MKTPNALLLFACFSLSSCIGRFYVDKSGEFKSSGKSYSFIQTYETPSDIQLELATSGGNIDVTGYEGKSVEVAFVVSKNNGDVIEMTLDELQKYASFQIRKEGHTLSIVVDEIFKSNISVGFIVRTPHQTTCTVSTSGGNLSMDDLTGDQKLETSGGNISLRKINGKCNAETSGGNIELEAIVGESNVSTSGGNIHASSIEGNLNAETSGGNIVVENQKGNTDVSTSGGNIHLAGLTGSVAARTSGGNVHAENLRIAQGLRLETNGGSIDCKLAKGLGMDLDLNGSDIQVDLVNFTGTKTSEQVIGKMNGGGIPIRIHSPGGSLELSFF